MLTSTDGLAVFLVPRYETECRKKGERERDRREGQKREQTERARKRELRYQTDLWLCLHTETWEGEENHKIQLVSVNFSSLSLIMIKAHIIPGKAVGSDGSSATWKSSAQSAATAAASLGCRSAAAAGTATPTYRKPVV